LAGGVAAQLLLFDPVLNLSVVDKLFAFCPSGWAGPPSGCGLGEQLFKNKLPVCELVENYFH
jgi:hypothetical protein